MKNNENMCKIFCNPKINNIFVIRKRCSRLSPNVTWLSDEAEKQALIIGLETKNTNIKTNIEASLKPLFS